MLHFLTGQDIGTEIGVLAVAVAWDAVLGEPRWLHPVAGMGRLVALAERWAPPSGMIAPLLYGLILATLMPAALAAGTYFLVTALRSVSPLAYILVGGLLLKSCFAVRQLDRAAVAVCRSLEQQRWEEARSKLKSLVSRDTAGLAPDLLASAAVESVAENTTDSFVAPWLAFAFLGLPGAVAYRAINTLDSMIGYRNSYEYLGKAAARLDDLANLIPARLAALFIVAAAYVRPLAAGRALQTMIRDHGKTESPNAGWTMSAMAGALGVQLQKVGHYKLGIPLRPIVPRDIREAVKLMRWVAAFALVIALCIVVIRYGLFQA